VSRQILHFMCAPFMRSPNGGRYALRIFPMRDLIRNCVSLWNAQGAVVNYRYNATSRPFRSVLPVRWPSTC